MGSNISMRSSRNGLGKADRRLVPEHLFVYGTLRRNHAPPELWDLMKSLRWIGKASAQGQLYDLGEYPGAVFNSDSRNKIEGEVYKLPC